jgi:hypothetical protein
MESQAIKSQIDKSQIGKETNRAASAEQEEAELLQPAAAGSVDGASVVEGGGNLQSIKSRALLSDGIAVRSMGATTRSGVARSSVMYRRTMEIGDSTKIKKLEEMLVTYYQEGMAQF